jgi:hypothetical protein
VTFDTDNVGGTSGVKTERAFVSAYQISQTKKQQRAISRAFDGACDELGIGMLGLDVWKREQLAQLILRLAGKGEIDSAALQRRAVTQFENTKAKNSSTS